MNTAEEYRLTLLPCPADAVDAIWKQVFAILKTAVDRDDGRSMRDVYWAIRNRDMQLWLAADQDNRIQGVGVTQITVFPQKRTCLLLYVAGTEWEQWRHFLGDLEHWAAAQGCHDLEFYGRPGWSRKKLDGYTQQAVVFNKRLGS